MLFDVLNDPGHETAFKHGILHRDVSCGNVMLADHAHFKGYLQDFDYSTFVGDCERGVRSQDLDKDLRDIMVWMS